MRSLANDSAVGYLRKLPGADERLELVVADLLQPGSFDAAVVDCDHVYHTARYVYGTMISMQPCHVDTLCHDSCSPFFRQVDKPDDLIRPAVDGTSNVLKYTLYPRWLPCRPCLAICRSDLLLMMAACTRSACHCSSYTPCVPQSLRQREQSTAPGCHQLARCLRLWPQPGGRPLAPDRSRLEQLLNRRVPGVHALVGSEPCAHVALYTRSPVVE